MGVAHLDSDSKKHTVHKHVKVTHVHAKTHRKRHYALLIASVALGISVITFLLVYINQAALGRAVASQTIESIFGGQTSDKLISVTSSYGFTASYNAKQYYASAIDAQTGGLYVGDELATSRAYDTIRLTTQATGYKLDTNSIRLTYYPHDAALAGASDVEQKYIVEKQTDPTQLSKVTTTTKDLHGVSFQRTEWLRKLTVGKLVLNTTFVTYSANLNGHPFTVVVYQGTQSADRADAFMQAMTFSDAVAAVTISPTAAITEKHGIAERLIDTILGIQIASAASAAPSYTASERVSATYGPAVVKVYNVYAADLMLDGQVVYPDLLDGGTGSGFIVSADGYVATNGHVVVNDAREVTIKLAITLASSGKSALLAYLINLTSLTSADVAGKTDTEADKVIVEALYNVDQSHFSFRNLQTNLLVGLGDKQVDIEELVTKTGNRQAYPEQDTIKKATLVDYNFEGEIRPSLTGKFTTSDVALIKLSSGSDYPMVKLGVMADAAQGSNLNIMGFPGTGSSSNGIVSKTVTSATLTTGKVSAQKKDSGGRSIIETDTEIGHGNSGGPAFTDAGDVIGIATYTSDSGNAGDGVLNYIRDIADFTNIADKKFVSYKTVSDTQKAWNKGIELFYQAHYKSAIPYFNKVKQLYPAHPQVTAMIDSSEKHIANGDNIDEFPVVLVVIIAVVALLGMGVAVVFIIAHKKKHQAYVHGVTTGQIQPMTPGMAPQSVTFAPSASMVPVSQPLPAQPVAPQPQPQPAAPFSVPVTNTPAPAAPVAPVPSPAPETPPESTPQWPAQ